MPITINIYQQPNGLQFQGSGTINLDSFIGKTQGNAGNVGQGIRFRSNALNNLALNRLSWIGLNNPNTNYRFYPNLFAINSKN